MNIPSERIDAFTEQLARRAEETGQVLFDGQWMTVEEAEQRYRRLKLDSGLKIAELVIALALMFIGSIMPFVLLAIVGGIAA